MKFLGFAFLSALACRGYSNFAFETPLQAAQAKNSKMETRHQYALAYLKQGKYIEAEFAKRKVENEKTWNELKT